MEEVTLVEDQTMSMASMEREVVESEVLQKMVSFESRIKQLRA